MAERRRTAFVLWLPAVTDPPPRLVLGDRMLDLRFADGLWFRPAAECDLTDGQPYAYWFEVTDSSPYGHGARIRCTDPFATTVDWRQLSPPLDPPYTAEDRRPAGVLLWRDGELVPCDPDGTEPVAVRNPQDLPPNNRTVYYKLPTTWARRTGDGGSEIATGTFADVRALVDADAAPANLRGIRALEPGRAHLRELGVTTLELTPIADTWVTREWGYSTSNYAAPDQDLGFPSGTAAPAPLSLLADLVNACHDAGIRFGYDAVMAFAQRQPYREIGFGDFFTTDEDGRYAFGGDLWSYDHWIDAYDPVEGKNGTVAPARQFHQAVIAEWILARGVDSIRVDSVNNIGNWDFVGEFTAYARGLHRQRDPLAGEAQFLVVGEELSVPVDLVRQNRVDALWNERFLYLVRKAILGASADTVRDLLDPRRLGFTDGSQAVNYVTSHDVQGVGKERLFRFLNNNGVTDTEPRIKLAFACLLTAVGIPLILAGEEFADDHDLPVVHPSKQIDPVNYDRLDDPWRRRVFTVVSRLVALRHSAAALSVNDVDVFHTDFTPGRRVLAWRRGAPGQDPVVVVANFSDWTQSPGDEYVVPGWPATPPGRTWHEVTQDRDVPAQWAGREPLYPWEAKVYALGPAS